MVNTERLSKKESAAIPLLRKVGRLVIAGFVLILTVVTGAIAGLIGMLVRGQMPETEALESAPKKEES